MPTAPRAVLFTKAAALEVPKEGAPSRWDEVEDRLRALWGEGKSAREIAEIFTADGFDCTRNGVMGRAGRLDLPKHENAPVKLVIKKMGADGIPDGAFGPWPTNPRACIFPIGDPGAPGFRFCGTGKQDLGPYCDHHHVITHAPASAPL